MTTKFLDIFDVSYFRFDGLPLPRATCTEERLIALKDFSDIRSDDVIVWGYPKSGNHFVHDIVRKLQHDGDVETAIKTAADCFMEGRLPERYNYNPATRIPQTLEELAELPSPRVLGTHVYRRMQPRQVQEGKCKVIYVIRNPKDVAVSYFDMIKVAMETFGMQMVPWTDFLEAFIAGEVHYGCWTRHVKDWYSAKDNSSILLIKYEDLKKDLKGQVKTIADFIGKDLSQDILDIVAHSCEFKAVKEQFPTSQFLRVGVSGGWKAHFTEAQSEAFDAWLEKELAGMGIEFSE